MNTINTRENLKIEFKCFWGKEEGGWGRGGGEGVCDGLKSTYTEGGGGGSNTYKSVKGGEGPKLTTLERTYFLNGLLDILCCRTPDIVNRLSAIKNKSLL